MRKNFMLDGVLGLAIGDALGVPVEFEGRLLRAKKPVNDMIGYGTHLQPAGSWSDDTSMTLATLDSLTRGYDLEDMMRRFCTWMNENAYTATGKLFDMGIATRFALRRFEHGVPLDQCGGRDADDNGNGSLMRMFPAAVFCTETVADMADRLTKIGDISGLTHAHPRAQLGCQIYAFLVWALMEERTPEAILRGLRRAQEILAQNGEMEHYARLFDPDFAQLPESEIRSSGYIVSTLEAAVWCLLTTDNFRDCVLKAVNLGNDTDTVAAVAGSLAGVLYGRKTIPEDWMVALKNKELIENLCEAWEQKNGKQ